MKIDKPNFVDVSKVMPKAEATGTTKVAPKADVKADTNLATKKVAPPATNKVADTAKTKGTIIDTVA